MNTSKCLTGLIVAFTLFAQTVKAQNEFDKSSLELGKLLTQIGKRDASIGNIRIDTATVNDDSVCFYASSNCAYIPFREDNVKEIYKKLQSFIPEELAKKKCGIYTQGQLINELIPLALRKKREKNAEVFTRPETKPLFYNISTANTPTRGLAGKHISVWPSHGLYYESKLTRWEWQRARIFQTVEDLYTRSYVMPFLVPMLENAGANVLIPRERDTQINEIIVDNDFNVSKGSIYTETSGDSNWLQGTGKGFAQLRNAYTDFQNPFKEGSFRQTNTIKKGKPSTAEWKPNIKESGKYAVYVSYQTLSNSTDEALYTVYHKGNTTSFRVNQQMGGGTWVYLGTFEFDKGLSDENKVTLSNLSSSNKAVVTADAVKFGGGIGNIARRNPSSDTIHANYPAVTSGYPRFAEGARYWMQWAGIPDTIYSPTGGENDYNDDYRNRGLWVNYMSGGSSVNPDEPGLNIPIDLSFAFHSDAGSTKNDGIIGTLGIYSNKGYDGKFYNGASRLISHDLCDLVQSYIVNDIRKLYAPEWNRRGMWNQPYFEAWAPKVPAMLLELLSHSNFADMRYGLDPRFRFTVSRAIYKGILRFISSQYNEPYVVQPLPVDHMAIRFTGKEPNEIELTWKAVEDTLEPTAKAEEYIVYTRIGDGDFDNGTLVKEESYKTKIPSNVVCSFKVTAVNKGGESFPSEILSVGRSVSTASSYLNIEEPVLVVNGFDRISAPADFVAPAPADTSLAGFLDDIDHGVPYINDFSYVGKMKEFRRDVPWTDDDSGGFGDSYGNYERKVIAGNTFDYPAVHGKAILAAGLSFTSCSNEAVEDSIVNMQDYGFVDLVLGKQCQTKMGRGGYFPLQFKTFSPAMQNAITRYCNNGGNIFVSGAFVATDLWCSRVAKSNESDKKFATEVLRYKWRNSRAATNGTVWCVASPAEEFDGEYNYFNELNSESYVVESPDAIEPATPEGYTIMRYPENNLSAGVACGGKYKTVILGFPFESLRSSEQRNKLMNQIIRFFYIK